ncbi:hypothetical protein RCL1_000205 [Eukaryota sp. TZLM3-RCL]
MASEQPQAMELLEDFEEDLSRRFPDQFISDTTSCTCPICLYVSLDSIRTTSCNHFFCKICIMRWIRQEAYCPICRKSLAIGDVLSLPDDVQSTLQSLILKCDYHSKGCTWEGPLSDFLQHLSSCQVAASHGYAPPRLDTDPHLFCKGDRVRVRVSVREVTGNTVPGDCGIVIKTETSDSTDFAICNFPAQSDVKVPFSDLILHTAKLYPFDLCRIRPVVEHLVGGWRGLDSSLIGVVRSSRFGSVSQVPSLTLPPEAPVCEAFSVVVDFASKGVHILDSRQLMVVPRRFEVQDKVKVRDDCVEPTYRWGRLHRSEEGSIVEVQRRESGDNIYIDFPSHRRWHGVSFDLQLLPTSFSLGDSVHLRSDLVAPLLPFPFDLLDRTSVGHVVESSESSEIVKVEYSIIRDDSEQSILIDVASSDLMSSTALFNLGDLVRVKSGLEGVRYGWGNITQNEVGVVVKREGMELRVDFPSQRNWHAWAPDMERAHSSLRVGNMVKIKQSAHNNPVFSGLAHNSVGKVVEIQRDDVIIDWSLGPKSFKCSSILLDRIPSKFKIGSRVQIAIDCINPTYGYGRVRRSEVGQVKRYLDNGELLIDFPNHPDWRAVPFELEMAPHCFRIGDLVRVKPSVTEPKYKFGNVTHSDVGVVRKVDGNFLRIDYDQHKNWAGFAPDLELADGQHRGPVVSINSKVRMKPDAEYRFLPPPDPLAIGTVTDILADDCTIDFPFSSSFLAHVDDLILLDSEHNPVATPSVPPLPTIPGFRIGQKVRVKSSISEPKFKWGNVKKGEVGTIKKIDDDVTGVVDFTSQSNWRAYLPDMESAEDEPIITDLLPVEDVVPAGERGLLPRVGDYVRVKSTVSQPAFQWGNVRPGDVGKLISINIDNGECRVSFSSHQNWHAKLEELEVVDVETGSEVETLVHSSSVRITVGDLVRVKPDVVTPRFRWGNVSHSSVGIVVRVEEAKCKVDFPTHKGWAALTTELDVIPWFFIPGDLVRIRSELERPSYQWQSVHPGTPAIVESVEATGDRQTCFLRVAGFSESIRFLNTELELVPLSFRIGDHVRVRPHHKNLLFTSEGDSSERIKSQVGQILSIDHDIVTVHFDSRDHRFYTHELIKTRSGDGGADSEEHSHSCRIA